MSNCGTPRTLVIVLLVAASGCHRLFPHEATEGDGPHDAPVADGQPDTVPSDIGPSDIGPPDAGPAGDGPAGDGPAGDGPAGDGPAGDGPAGDGPAGDGPLIDASSADGEAGAGACGDGICQLAEDCASCAADCGACGCGGVSCSQPDVHCIAGGTITSEVGAWRMTHHELGLQSFTLTGTAGLRLFVCDLDLSTVSYTGTNPTYAGLGAFAGAGFGVPGKLPKKKGVFFNLTSAVSGLECTGSSTPTHDDGYRKYLAQTYYSDVLSELGHQYNIERDVFGSGLPQCETFDLRLDLTPLAGGEISYQAWIRLKQSTAPQDGCSPGWNKAGNTVSSPTKAWVQLKKHALPTKDDHEVTPPLGHAQVKPMIFLQSGVDPSNPQHAVGWSSATVVVTP